MKTSITHKGVKVEFSTDDHKNYPHSITGYAKDGRMYEGVGAIQGASLVMDEDSVECLTENE